MFNSVERQKNKNKTLQLFCSNKTTEKKKHKNIGNRKWHRNVRDWTLRWKFFFFFFVVELWVLFFNINFFKLFTIIYIYIFYTFYTLNKKKKYQTKRRRRRKKKKSYEGFFFCCIAVWSFVFIFFILNGIKWYSLWLKIEQKKVNFLHLTYLQLWSLSCGQMKSRYLQDFCCKKIKKKNKKLHLL